MRGSDPAGEVAETHAKAAGVLAALGVRPSRPRAERERPRLADDPRVRAALDGRRSALAPFWLRMQERAAAVEGHALVVDGEDTFTAMLAHVLRSGGLEVTVRRYDEPGLRAAVLAHEGPVVLGPGPGDPADLADPKMRLLRELTATVIREHRHGVLGVCLGHELIAAELGLETVRKEVPYQGAQTTVDLFGRPETVGFYNSFVARCDEETARELAAHGIEVSRAANGEVHALRGPGFAGVQFHPESVLSLNGAAVVRELIGQAAPGEHGELSGRARGPRGPRARDGRSAEEHPDLRVQLRVHRLQPGRGLGEGTRTMSVPRRATIVPKSPSWTQSTACSPNRVASQRSKALGVPPRWTWPRTVVRASLPVRLSISLASHSPTPESRTCPKESSDPSLSTMSPSFGMAPSATTTIGAYDARKREVTQAQTCSTSKRCSGMRMTLAPLTRPECRAIQPA